MARTRPSGTKPTVIRHRRCDRISVWQMEQQRKARDECSERRRRRFLCYLNAVIVRRVVRHDAEYPAGPAVHGDQDFYQWLETRNSSRGFESHWSFMPLYSTDERPLPVRSAEPCQRCRDNPRELREPFDSCSMCTTRDMCYVQFRNGKVIIAPNTEDRWSF